MNSRQRKTIYACAIVVLLVPIIWLGRPSSGTAEGGSGGKLAQMRQEYDLGENALGNIDPTSSAMNLVLLGLRGPAASVLHQRALEYQGKKDWAKLRATVDSIIKLQPHYEEVWKFQGWNLSYNVSREWDKVDDRFYWVKEGIKFTKRGTERNLTSAILFHTVAEYVGRKIGMSDEKRFFRKFFIDDPDDALWGANSPDTEINPDAKDNYLVAKDWYTDTNEIEALHGIDGVEEVFARQGPSRAQMSYASVIEQEDDFSDEPTADELDEWKSAAVAAWDKAHYEWTEEYGKDRFKGLDDVLYMLNANEADLRSLADENGVTLDRQLIIFDQNVKMVNYNVWTEISEAEKDMQTVEAHLAFRLGKRAYAKGLTNDSLDENEKTVISEAEQHFHRGLELMEKVLDDHPAIRIQDTFIDEIMIAAFYYKRIHELNGKEMPRNFPLAAFMQKHREREPDIYVQWMIETQGM